MESGAGNIMWPSEISSESNLDCLIATSVTTSPIFVDESGSGVGQPSGLFQALDRPQPKLPPVQFWGSLSDEQCQEPKSKKIKLELRAPDDFGFMIARKKWQEAFWMTEENKKVQELIANKNLAIFTESEQARLAKVELAKATVQLAKFKKTLIKSEERSRKVAQANAKMLAYISKQI